VGKLPRAIVKVTIVGNWQLLFWRQTFCSDSVKIQFNMQTYFYCHTFSMHKGNIS